jgi:diguanylate cyclase (GGDEF)-like protein
LVSEKGLRVYALLSRLPFPKSYLGKILLAAFVGTHLPLIAMVLYLTLYSPIGFWPGLGVLAVVLLATLLGTGTTLWVLYSLLKPVSLASEALRDYLDHGKKIGLPLGFTDRAGRLMADVRYAIEHLDEVICSLEERSTRDYLTGAYNRRTCEERLAGDLARAKRDRTTLTFALMDLDQFKEVNDRYGHQAGDACLKHAAYVVGRSVRKGDWFARWGGDEFALVLWDSGEEHQGKTTLERIAKELSDNPVMLPGGEAILLTLSGGACSSHTAGGTVQEVFSRADEALYQAKEEGKNRFVYV